MTTSPAARADARSYFSEEEIERSRAYHRPLYAVFAGSTLVSLGFLGAVAFSSLGRWLAAPVDGLPRWAFAASYTSIVVVVGAVVRFPIAFWRGYRYEHRWGFSTQRATGWLVDWAKGLGVQVILTSGVFLAFVELAARLHGTWPLAAGPAAVALVVFLSFIAPVVLEPVFNRFRPLEDAELSGTIHELAERAGTAVRDVLVADASRRTRKENAYVSGLGRTRRVVVYDTLLRRAPHREIGLIVAHELGHRRERHVVWGTLLGAAGAAASVAVLWALLRVHAVLSATHASGPADPRVIPLVLFAASALELVSMPVGTAISRRWEMAADRFGIRLTGDAPGYAEMAKNLGLTNLADLTPSRPVYYLLFTHPSIPERIAAALSAVGPTTA